MKIAIFSDIHGNIFSFEKIYQKLKKEKCDLHLFLGDICGYYYHQNEAIEILREIPNLYSLCGNHDRMFLDSLENEAVMEHYSKTYGRSFEFLKAGITPQNLEFLRQLPLEFTLDQYGIAAFHGSPWNPIQEYIYPDTSMERFDELPYKVVFLGHTHRPMDVRREGIRIVNPGSAGQPRDGGWPTYAVYETDTDKLDIHGVPYDVDAMIEVVKKREDSNVYLVEALRRIRQ
jgi:putative phosphoesterase